MCAKEIDADKIADRGFFGTSARIVKDNVPFGMSKLVETDDLPSNSKQGAITNRYTLCSIPGAQPQMDHFFD